MAPWSAWVTFGPDAVANAPREPGVYMLRENSSGQVVYVGMAGERRGQGLRGRLRVYLSGKGMVSGLGEAAMDRALADEGWVQARLDEVKRGEPRRAKEWARLAVTRADLSVRWVTADSPATALQLETQVVAVLDSGPLWNRRL